MNVFKTILSWILSIVLGVSLFTVFMLGNISSFFTEDSMQKTVENIDVSHEISKIKNSSATSGNKAEIADIIDMAYNEAESHGISTKLVDEIFNSTEVKQFLGKAVGSTTDAIINGTDTKPVTSEEFNKLLDDNMDKWIKKSGVEISDSKKEVLVIRMKSASAGVIDNLPSANTLTKKVNQNTVDQIQFLFSAKVKTALIIISVACLLLLIALKRKNNKWLLYGGIPPLIAGLFTIGISFIIVDVLTAALNEYNLSFMVSAFSNALSHNIMVTGLVSIIVSILFFITYGLLGKKKSKN